MEKFKDKLLESFPPVNCDETFEDAAYLSESLSSDPVEYNFNESWLSWDEIPVELIADFNAAFTFFEERSKVKIIARYLELMESFNCIESTFQLGVGDSICNLVNWLERLYFAKGLNKTFSQKQLELIDEAFLSYHKMSLNQYFEKNGIEDPLDDSLLDELLED